MSDAKSKRDAASIRAEPAHKATEEKLEGQSEGIAAKASDAWDKTKEVGHRAADAAAEGIDHLAHGTRAAVSRSRDVAQDRAEDLRVFVSSYPLTTVLAGVGAGLLVGFALGNNHASKRSRRRWWQ